MQMEEERAVLFVHACGIVKAEQNSSKCDLIRHPPGIPQRSREMSLHSSSTSIVEHPGAGETQLQGKWLALARIGWVTFTLLVLGVFFANLPADFAYLHMLNTFPGGPQISSSDVQTLQAHGLSLDAN
jgi:hypothetical protein